MTETNINNNDFLEKAKNAKNKDDIINVLNLMNESLLNAIKNSKKQKEEKNDSSENKELNQNENLSQNIESENNSKNIFINNTFEINNNIPKINLEYIDKNNNIFINISETQKIVEKEAERFAKEKYLEEVKNSNFFKKFFTELFLKNKKIENFKEKYIKNREKNFFEEKMAYASSKLNQENDLKLFHPEFINLSNNYINGFINKEKLEEEFQEKIIKVNFDENYFFGTDLFLKLDKYKNYKDFLKSLKFSFFKEMEIKNFLKNFENRQILENQLGFKINEKSLDYTINFLSNIDNLENLLNENFEIKIFFPNLENTALEVDYSKNKENNFFYKTGKFLEKKPILSTFGTSLGLIGTSLIPIIGKVFGATGLGLLSGAKKSKQYTDNHKEAIERISFSEKNEFEENLKNINPENLNKFKKFLYNLNLKKLKLYKKNGIKEKGTIHRHFIDINFLTRKINFYLEKIEDLTEEEEKRYLVFWLAQAKARIDLGNEEKTSFLKSSNFENSEKEFTELIFTMENGFKKLGDILETPEYKTFFNETLAKNKGLLRKDLNKANKGFEKIKAIESSKNFASTAIIYLISSFILSELIEKFNKFEEIIIKESIQQQEITITEINNHISKKLSEITGFTEISQLENFLNNDNNISFWEKIVQISGNETQGNKIKNQLLEIILEAKDNEGKSKLFLEAQQSGILKDFENNGEHSQKIMKKLAKWGYAGINKEEILSQLNGLNNGSLKIENLAPNKKIILSEVMFDYLDKESYWEQLKNVFFDKKIIIEDKIINGGTERVIKEKFNLDFLKEIGIPVHFNRYFSKIKKEEKNNQE